MTEHRAEIEALLATWSRCIDSGRATEAIDLYTEDAQQTSPAGTSSGKAAILAGLQKRQDLAARTTRHLVSNLRLQPAPGGQLQGQWVLTLFRSDQPERPAVVQLVADVEDVYRQVEGRWRIARRKATPVFGAP